MTKTVITHCRYCVGLCGIAVEVNETDNEVLSIRPDRDNPFSWRDFCKKGKTAGEARDHPHRFTTPMRRVDDRYVPASYDEALNAIATKFNAIIDRYGVDAIGSYHGNPMGMNFHDTVFHSGLLAAIGTPNRFWVGSVDQNAAHIVAEQMYGSEIMSLVPDVDRCDYFLLLGMDPAVSKFGWLDLVPDGWSRVQRRRVDGARVVIVDPRASTSAGQADLHIAPIPGTDWAFLLALIAVIFAEGLQRPSSAVPLSGLEDIRAFVAGLNLAELAEICGVPAPTLTEVARDFATARTAMCVTHTGVAHNIGGTIGEWLGHVLNAVVDRLDRPGGRRYERGVVDLVKAFSFMAPKSKHISRIRQLPTVAGYHSLAELPDEITTPGPGQIRAVLMAAGNPVVSGPQGAALDRALAELECLVVVDLVQRESHRHAHWLIPGTHWLERSEFNPTMTGAMDRPFAQMSRRSVQRPTGVWEEWEFYLELGLHMGRPLFGMRGVNTIAKASRALARSTGRTGLGINGDWVSRGMVAMGRRVKYRDIANSPHGMLLGEARFGDLAGAVATPDGQVRLAPPDLLERCRQLLAADSASGADNGRYPYRLISRRHRESLNSWLNETPDTHKAERENRVEIHPDDAVALGITDGQRVRVSSESDSVVVATRLVDGGRPGVVSMQFGWGSRVFDPTTGAVAQPGLGVNRNLLTSNASFDPLSQNVAFNATRVRLDPVELPAMSQEAETDGIRNQ